MENNIYEYCLLYKKGAETRMCVNICLCKHKKTFEVTQETKRGENNVRTRQMGTRIEERLNIL